MKDAKFLHAENDDFDKTERVRRLICVFLGRTCQNVCFCRFGSIVSGTEQIFVSIHYCLQCHVNVRWFYMSTALKVSVRLE